MVKQGLLLIGDSKTKDFDKFLCLSDKFDVTIISKSGLKLEDVDVDMLKATEFFSQVVIHVATNNIQVESADVIKEKAQNLVNQILRKNSSIQIYISGILPRGQNCFIKNDDSIGVRAINSLLAKSINETSQKLHTMHFLHGSRNFLQFDGSIEQHLLSQGGLRLSHPQRLIHRNVSGGGSSETHLYPRTCDVCHKIYASKHSYSTHFRLKRCTPKPNDVKEAEISNKLKNCNNKSCNFKYVTLPQLLKHLDECCQKTNEDIIPKADSDCQKTNEDIIPKADPLATGSLIVCPDCSSAYSNSSSYSKHFKTCLNNAVQFTKCIAPTCSIKFRTYAEMLKHLEIQHKVDLSIQNLSFPSIDEFFSWKQKEEQSSHIMYVKNRENFNSALGNLHYYVCKFDAQRRADSSPKTCRRKFCGDTIKNTDCPSRMYVTEKSDSVLVKYVSCHNHELKFKNVKHFRWHPDTKNVLNSMISKEIPSHKIKEDLGPSSIDSAQIKEHFISTTQISKMKYEFNQKKHLHKNDAMSVDLLVKSLIGEEKESIIVYKPQKKPVEIGGNSVQHLLSDNDTFALVIQSDRQRTEMLRGCEDILVIDATHSTNKYDFHLVNLIVPDEFGIGYPVGHFITNKVDTPTMTACFRAIKDKCPDLNVNVFITDDDPALYNSVTNVFPDAIHLLCTWHIKRAWKKNLREKVKDTALRAKIRQCLHVLMEEKNPDNFKKMLTTFLKEYKDKTSEFCEYFSSYYQFRSELWAMSYRNFPHANTDTTNFCESFHNRFKSSYLMRKFNRRVDDLIRFIFRVDKDLHLGLMYRRLTEEIPGGKKNRHDCRHMKAMRIVDEDVKELSASEFEVTSQSQSNVCYSVKLISATCPEPGLCNVVCTKSPCKSLCRHMYVCSCQDISDLCKHIHKVHSINLPPNFQNSDSDEDNDLEDSFHGLHLFAPLENNNAQSKDVAYEKLVKSCNTQISELQLLLCEEKTRPLLSHIEKELKLLVSQCKGLIASDSSHTPLPEMEHNSVPPNTKLQTQSIELYRTSKKKGDSRKSHKLFVSESERASVRTSLLTPPLPNFSGSISLPETVTDTLFVEGPYTVKLYHMKSLDSNISNEDIEKIALIDPRFSRGWLYDCIIYSYLVKIASDFPTTKIVDPCLSQVVKYLDRENFQNLNVPLYKKLIIPCNPTEDHWLLLVAYPDSKVIEFYDPASNTVKHHYHQFIGQWAKVLAKYSGSPLADWKVCLPIHDLQCDSISCGVYVAWYAEKIVLDQPVSTPLNVDNHRLSMYQSLKENYSHRQ